MRRAKLLLIAGLALLIAGCEPPAGQTIIGSPAPDFTLKTLDGSKEVKLSDLKGKPTLLVFWASWCGPCMMELPHLKSLNKEFRESLNLVSIAVQDDDINDSKKAAAEKGIDWTAVHDGNRTVGNLYGVNGIPHLVLIGGSGNVKQVWVGMTPESEIREEIRNLIQQQQAGAQ